MTTEEKSIDDKVAEVFDEFQAALLEKKNFHPSEVFHNADFKCEYSNSKVFRIINSYHVYCNLCNHHMYSRSQPLDINSFFQKHINTDYHQLRCNEQPHPNFIPMFTWQEKWHSGRCNVCEMSDINAYAIDMNVHFSDLLLNHDCFWKKMYENGNELFLTKLRGLKKYCGLSFFRDKFMKKINGKAACSLCRVQLSGSEKKDRHHFTSNHHYKDFVILISNMFNFLPKDLLNGFNLEYVTRCILKKDFPLPKELIDLKEREKCLNASNSNPILGESLQMVRPELFAPLGGKYFEKILKEKLELVELVFPVKIQTKSFCEVCDQIVPISSQESHLGGVEHGLQVEKWESVKRSLKNPKYFEPFLKVSGVIICLICKRVLDYELFFSHLKGSSHMKKFERYLKCKFPHPISSAIKIRSDFTSYCPLCKTSINSQPTLPMLKANLKKLHWPCPSIWKYKRSKKNKKPSTVSKSNEETNFNRQSSNEKNLDRGSEEEMNPNLQFDEEINHGLESNDEMNRHELSEMNSQPTLPMLKTNLKKLHGPCPSIWKNKRSKKNKKPSTVSKSNEETNFNGQSSNEKNLNRGSEEEMNSSRKFDEEINPNRQFDEEINHSRESNDEMNRHELSEMNSQPTLPMLKTNLKKLHGPCPSIWKNKRNKKNKKPSTVSESNEETNFNQESSNEKNLYRRSEEEMNSSRKFDEQMNSRPGSDEEINLSLELIDERVEREANVDPKDDENTSEPDPISGVELEVVSETETKEQPEPISIDFDRPDFRTVEKSLEGIMEAFEGKIVEHVKKKSVSLLRSITQSVVKPEKAENQQTVPEEEEEEEEEESESEINFVENHGNHESGDRQGSHKKATENRKGKEEKAKEKTKRKIMVLVVKGLPKSRFKYQTLLDKFNRFGRIRALYFSRNELIVNFTEAGVAESIVKDHPDFIKTVFPPDLELELEIRGLRKKGFFVNKDVAFLLENPAELLKFVQRLVNESIIACESQVEINREEQVCRAIIKAVSDSFPQCRCYPFGSRLSGLTLHNSDIDVFMDSGDVYDGINSKSGSCETTFINKIAGLLRNMRPDIINLTVVARARVPIISFFHKPTRLHCDLSFKNGLSVQNTLLLKFMVSLDPRVRSLILFLKFWANLNKIHGPPFFSSYAIAMMTLYFLQQLPSPVVPTIESLQKAVKGRRMTIGGWDCSFISNAKAVPKTENVDTIPELLAGFFSFYANFDYAKYVISPLTGKPLPKAALKGNVKLPMAYKRHVLNIPFDSWKSDFNKPLCVLDPFDLGHVLTKSLTKHGLQLFIFLCKRSHDLLKKTPGK